MESSTDEKSARNTNNYDRSSWYPDATLDDLIQQVGFAFLLLTVNVLMTLILTISVKILGKNSLIFAPGSPFPFTISVPCNHIFFIDTTIQSKLFPSISADQVIAQTYDDESLVTLQ